MSAELLLHMAVAEFLDWVVMPPALWTTFPAGWTAMNKGQAGRLKACGLKAGMPDIMVFHDGFTLGIELKAGGHGLTEAQKEMHPKLLAAGVRVCVARSIDVVEHILRVHNIPIRKINYGSSLTTSEIRCPQEPAQGKAPAAP